MNESGWRDHSPSALSSLFADAGFRGQATTLHLNLIAAETNLTGNGVVPVELLAARGSAVFTYPDRTKNSYFLASANAKTKLGGPWSLTTDIYLSGLRQRTLNADASDAQPCDDVPGFVCFEDGSLVTDSSGAMTPDFLSAGIYGQLNRTSTKTFGYGAAAQFNFEGTLFGRPDHAILGAAFDHAHSQFEADSELGTITTDRTFEGPSIIIDQADGSVAPVRVVARNSYYGFYLSNVVELTEAIAISASARFNIAKLGLQDKIGTALDGQHRFSRFNPAIGVTAKIVPEATL